MYFWDNLHPVTLKIKRLEKKDRQWQNEEGQTMAK
jgi:hypothetical protein